MVMAEQLGEFDVFPDADGGVDKECRDEGRCSGYGVVDLGEDPTENRL